MKYSDIIMPCSTRNEKIEEFQVEMIDSFVKNTPDECKLWMIENNSDSDSHSRFKDYVQSKKQNFVYMPFDFNLSKLYTFIKHFIKNLSHQSFSVLYFLSESSGKFEYFSKSKNGGELNIISKLF